MRVAMERAPDDGGAEPPIKACVWAIRSLSVDYEVHRSRMPIDPKTLENLVIDKMGFP